jgi:hypothetical protein
VSERCFARSFERGNWPPLSWLEDVSVFKRGLVQRFEVRIAFQASQENMFE